MYLEKLKEMKQKLSTDLSNRIFSELNIILQLNKFKNNAYDDVISKNIEYLYTKFIKMGYFSIKDVKFVENNLIFLQDEIKNIEVICVGHAHLDMNWLWGFDETVAIVCATMDTVLHLLDKYKDFTFAQSQASVYKILNDFRPDLLKKIKKYIKQGRFEVTAGSYVESDKNIPNASSLIDQIQFSRDYLSKTLSINKEDINIDFEPDTFGHSIDVPEILYQSGIKYYYHCRGNNNPAIYKWQSKAGNTVLVYREPQWYNSSIDYNSFEHVVDFAHKYGIKKVLKVFGVGDHGGGPTISDIEMIKKLGSFPLMPKIKFGTYKEFFNYLDSIKNWPVHNDESNFIFRGCYSSQSQIKTNNAISEINLYKAGFYQTISNNKNCLEMINKARDLLLFNQFHDILPGSGSEQTRIYSLATYQQINAYCSTAISTSLQKIAKQIDTTIIYDSMDIEKNNTSFGAGSGYHCKDGYFLNNKTYSNQRAYAIFNSSSFKGRKVIKLDLWDYKEDINNIEIIDEKKNNLNFCIASKSEFYWSHDVSTIEVEVDLKPYGYTLVCVRQKIARVKDIDYPPMYERTESKDDLTLENQYVKVEFDQKLNLTKFYDYMNKNELINEKSNFCYCIEDGSKLMSAWVSGRIDNEIPLDNKINVKQVIHNEIKDEIIYSTLFGESSQMNIAVTLYKCDPTLYITGNCIMQEKGEFGKQIPRLEYQIHSNEINKVIKCTTQLGCIERKITNEDVPSQQGIYVGNDKCGLLIYGQGKYGYRIKNDSINMILLRSTFDPDKLPEYGERNFKLSLSPCINNDIEINKNLFNNQFNPDVVSVPYQNGVNLDSLIEVSKNITLINLFKDENDYMHLIFKNDSNQKEIAKIKLNFIEKITNCVDNADMKNIQCTKNTIEFEIDNNSFIHLLAK